MKQDLKIGFAACTLMKDVFNDFTATRPDSQRKVKRIAEVLAPLGHIVSAGLVEDEAQARQARELFARENVGLVVYVALSYVKSSVALELFRDLDAPIVVWNTQSLSAAPARAGFDTMWTDSGMAGLPGTIHSLMRAGKHVDMVTSHVEDPRGIEAIGQIVKTTHASGAVRSARIATVGHVYEGMTDFMIDHEDLRISLGPLVVPVDPFRVSDALRDVPVERAERAAAEDRRTYGKVVAADSALVASARLALAMEQVLCEEEDASAVGILDQTWLRDPDIGIVATYGYMHLNRRGIPCVCEVDVATAVSQLVLEELLGPSMLGEFYDMDFESQAIMICHDSNGNPALARSPADVTLIEAPLYVGAHGPGVACEFACPPGDVTLLGLAHVDGRWRFVVCEGTSLQGPERPMGAPSMLFRHASKKLEEFCSDWCTSGIGHHMGVAYGKASAAVERLAAALGTEVVCV